MTYSHYHLLDWLRNHTCINLSELSKQAGVPKDSLRHFVKERRNISEDNRLKIEQILIEYGYKPELN